MTLHEGGSINPATFGEQLRRTREGAGLLIEDIVAETKVSAGILTALENGDFKRLPERVFSRSFVAQYATTVGVDERPLVEAFDLAWDGFAHESGIHARIDLAPQDLGTSIRWGFWLPIAAGVVILLVAAAVILRGSSPAEQTLSPDPRRSAASQVAGNRPPESGLSPTRPPEPASSATDSEAESLVRMTVEVADDEECWIHYRDRNGMTGQRLVAGGERVSLELAGPVKLTVGNAGAVRVTVDGRTYSDLGRPGQVVHTEITESGFEPLGVRRLENG